MPNIQQKYSYSFRIRCTTAVPPWLPEMMQKCSSSRLFFTPCGGLFRLWINQALSDSLKKSFSMRHPQYSASHCTFLQTFFGLEGPCDTVSLLRHPSITLLELHTKANCPRASVIFVRKPTWIQSEKMQTTGCLQRYSPSIPRTAQTEERRLWRLHLPDLFYSSPFKLTYCSHLLRESKKRENLKASSVSTTLGCPSQRATECEHLGKSPLLIGDRCP